MSMSVEGDEIIKNVAGSFESEETII